MRYTETYHDKPTKAGFIYAIYDVRHPHIIRYVGLTRTSLSKRFSGHKGDALRGGKLPLHRFLLKRQEDNYSLVGMRVLEEPEEGELGNSEIKWIAYYRERGMADLNLSSGGEGGPVGFKFSPEQRLAMGVARKGLRAGEEGPNPKLTWKDVSEMREFRKVEWVSDSDLAEIYGVTQSVISRVMRNKGWVDPDYDPSLIKERPGYTYRNHTVIDWDTVNEVRALRAREWISDEEMAERYGIPHASLNNILNNKRWMDPGFDPGTIIRRGLPGRPNAKITEDDVREIRRRCANGEKQRAVGADYGIDQVQVSRIVRKIRWAHVQ